MWRKVLTPTLLVISIWIVIGGTTTFYLHRYGELQDRVLHENVATIQAVARMQNTLLRLQPLLASDHPAPVPTAATRVEKLVAEFQQALTAAGKSVATPEAGALAEELRQRSSAYNVHVREWLQRPSTADPSAVTSRWNGPVSVEDLAGCLERLLEINERLLWRSAARSQFYGWLIPLRITLMVLGPVLGIACGLWIARGFHHSIARISVTLSNTGTGVSQQLGQVTVTPADDLPALQRQVDAVGAHIRSMVDQLHETQQQLLRSERLAAVGQLAAGVAHELRNPLTSVKLLIQTAARRGPAPSLSEKQLWVIQEEIARMEITIQGLLDFARPAVLDRVRHDLRETVQRAVNLIEGRAKQQGVTIRLRTPEQAVMVDGDPAQIHQVFVNLLLNGIDAAAHGGTLDVAITAPDMSSGCCRVMFRDSGPGIPETFLGQIFEPFVTTKEHGTGLGLAVSRRIVVEHGGTIAAVNSQQGGAEFTVALPTWAVAGPTDTAHRQDASEP